MLSRGGGAGLRNTLPPQTTAKSIDPPVSRPLVYVPPRLCRIIMSVFHLEALCCLSSGASGSLLSWYTVSGLNKHKRLLSNPVLCLYHGVVWSLSTGLCCLNNLGFAFSFVRIFLSQRNGIISCFIVHHESHSFILCPILSLLIVLYLTVSNPIVLCPPFLYMTELHCIFWNPILPYYIVSQWIVLYSTLHCLALQQFQCSIVR